MFKVGLLSIKFIQNKNHSDFFLEIYPSFIDSLIAFITLASISTLIWLYVGSIPILAILIWLAFASFIYDSLEYHTRIYIQQSNQSITIETRKLNRISKQLVLPFDQIHDIQLAGKDLRMNGNKAYRLEIICLNGHSIPLSNAYVVNEKMIESMRLVQKRFRDELARQE